MWRWNVLNSKIQNFRLCRKIKISCVATSRKDFNKSKFFLKSSMAEGKKVVGRQVSAVRDGKNRSRGPGFGRHGRKIRCRVSGFESQGEEIRCRPPDFRAKVGTVALSLGERVSRSGALTSRSGTGEGSVFTTSRGYGRPTRARNAPSLKSQERLAPTPSKSCRHQK